MKIGAALKVVVNPKRWFDADGSVALEYDQPMFVVEGQEYTTLEEALATKPWIHEFDLGIGRERKMAIAIAEGEENEKARFAVLKVGGGMRAAEIEKYGKKSDTRKIDLAVCLSMGAQECLRLNI